MISVLADNNVVTILCIPNISLIISEICRFCFQRKRSENSDLRMFSSVSLGGDCCMDFCSDDPYCAHPTNCISPCGISNSYPANEESRGKHCRHCLKCNKCPVLNIYVLVNPVCYIV